jgi:hypothetical protein
MSLRSGHLRNSGHTPSTMQGEEPINRVAITLRSPNSTTLPHGPNGPMDYTAASVSTPGGTTPPSDIRDYFGTTPPVNPVPSIDLNSSLANPNAECDTQNLTHQSIKDNNLMVSQLLPSDAVNPSNMALTLQTINASLLSLSESFRNLDSSHHELRDEFGKLRVELRTELQTTKSSLDTRFIEMEKKVLHEIDSKNNDLTRTWNTHREHTDREIANIRDQTILDNRTLQELKQTMENQQTKLSDMEMSLEEKTRQIADLQSQLDQHISTSEDIFTGVQNGVDEARILANDVEAHGRRWAVRIMGYRAPSPRTETIDQAKELVLQFLTKQLNVNNIRLADIDCAHRIRAVRQGNQSILAKFFRRDHVDLIMSLKKKLKGKDFLVYQDTTMLNRRLLNDLKDRPEVDSSWCAGGTAWCKLTAGGHKMKVSINDNINYVLSHAPAPPPRPVTQVTQGAPTDQLGNQTEQNQPPLIKLCNTLTLPCMGMQYF